MLNVGTLIALLKLQDEMSPALVDASARLSSFGSAASSAGLALSAGITAPLVGMAYAAVNAGLDFESVMNQIQGVLQPTEAEMERLRQTAMQMGADTIFSASEAATAILELGKAGFTTGQAIAAVDDVLLLAAAANMEMGVAAEFAAKTIQGFGLEVSDLAHVNDVLAAAVNQTALDISDLQVAFGYIGPIAQGFGLSIEQASAALAIMVEAGVPAETAARSLRDALSDLANPVGQTRDAMEALGIATFKTTDGSLMPFADVIQLLEQKGLSSAEAIQLFGKASGPAMKALIDEGRLSLDQLTASFVQSDGAARAMADAMMSGLPGAIEFLKGSIDTLFITISKQLEPAIISATGYLEDAADFLTAYVIPAFSSLPTPIQATALGIAVLAAAIGPALLLFGGMATGLSSLVTFYGMLVPASAAATGATALLTSALTVLGYALAAAVVGIGTYTATLAALDATGASEYIEYFSLRVQRFFGLIDSGATNQDLWNAVTANTARRMGEVSEATARTYDEMAKLPGVVQGTTVAELEFNEILNQNTASLTNNAEAIAWANQQASAWRSTLNWLGEQYMALDAAAYAHERQVEALSTSYQVATANVGLAVEQFTALRDVQASTLPFSYHTIAAAADHAKAAREQEAALAAAGMAAFDFSAHVSNNASAMAAATAETYRLRDGYLTIGSVVLDLGNVAGIAAEAFAIMADASGASWATVAAQAAAVAQDLISIWTDPNTGVVDKIINSALRIGAAIGDALHHSGGEKIMADVGRDWGVSITEAMGDAIYETAKELFGGDRSAAQLFHIADLIDAAGGLNDVNFDRFAAKLRDVFVMLETGMFDSTHAVTVLQENWQDFVEAGIDGAGRLSPALAEIMDLTQRFALEMADPALADQFVDQWLVLVETLNLGIRENFDLTVSQMFDMFQLVAEGVLPIQAAIDAIDASWDLFVEAGTNAVTGLLDPALQQAILSMRELGIESEAVTAYIADQLSVVVEGLNERVTVFGRVVEASLEDGIGASERFGFALEQLGTDAVGLQEEFDRLGVFTVGTFGALVSEGHSLRDALDLVSESLDQLALGEEVLGLSASAALDQLFRFRDIVEVNSDVFTSIDGIQKMMAGLANTGYLTQELFSAFGADLATQFDRLIDNGVAANDALLLMQPSLQTLWELQHNFGFEVDAGTQALLDQAEAAGIVGGAFQDVMERIEDILLSIAEALGAEIPSYLRQTTDATESEIEAQRQAWQNYYADVGSMTSDFVGDYESTMAGLYSGPPTAEGIAEYWQGLGIPTDGNGYIDWGALAGSDYARFGPGGGVTGGPRGLPMPIGGAMPGAGGCGCGVTIGPVIVADGTAPSVGRLFLDALYDEIMHGGGMDRFRRLVCEAQHC